VKSEVRNSESAIRRVLVCFAVKEEAGAFRKPMADNTGVSILVTGIGQDNSRSKLLERLGEFTPAFVLTCGFAGGLDPALTSGEVVFSTDNASLRARLTMAGAKPVKFYCAPRIATTVAEKAGLRCATGADAVEMESETIQKICSERRIPCATVRVISDAANENLPLDFNQLSKSDLSLDFGKLAWAIAKSPGKIPPLLRLQKNCRRAATRLAELLAKVVAPGQSNL